MTREEKIAELRESSAGADHQADIAALKAEAHELAGSDGSYFRQLEASARGSATAYLDHAMRLACQPEEAAHE